MYVSPNFKTKKELIAAGKTVTVYSPGLGTSPMSGREAVEGPHFPEPHRWYATVTIVDGKVTKVE